MDGQMAELVALGPTTVAFVSGGGLSLSTNGGGTWQAVELPQFPPPWRRSFTDLMVMPDGILLLARVGWLARPSWYRLPPGATVWLPVPGLEAEPVGDALLVHGDRLWWVQRASGPQGQNAQSTALP